MKKVKEIYFVEGCLMPIYLLEDNTVLYPILLGGSVNYRTEESIVNQPISQRDMDSFSILFKKVKELL